MENFTPIAATIGGVLIGLSAAAMMLFHGRIAGISGIVSGLIGPKPGEIGWRLAFVGGLLVGGVMMGFLMPSGFAVDVERSAPAIAVAGVIVGFGTRLGSGCTSGHGVCGISRVSPRSMVATVTFMATGAITATIVTQLFGGTL